MKKPPKISEEDRQLFRETVKDAKPLKAQQKVQLKKQTPKKPVKTKPSTEKNTKEIRLHDSTDNFYKSQDEILFNRPGLQQKQLRQLRQGKQPIEASIDLHGLTSEEARDSLEVFLNTAIAQSIRYVHIIHGKGQHINNDVPILKNKVYGWLKNCPNILAFFSCQKRHGGTGALYVILKKQSG